MGDLAPDEGTLDRADPKPRIADPKVASDHARMAQACRELETARAEVARLYARWAELERKRR